MARAHGRVLRAAAPRKERREASRAMAILRGMAMAIVAGHAEEALALWRMNHGRRGGRYTISDALVAELAAARIVGKMAYLELQGYVRKITAGACTVTAPQLWRRIHELPVEEIAGGMRVGEFDVMVRSRRGGHVIRARRRRRRRAAVPRVTVTDNGRMAVISAGPCAVQEPGSAIDTTYVATGNRSAGMVEKWGLRAVGKRSNHRMTLAAGIYTRRGLAMVVTRDDVSDGATLLPCARALRRSGALRRADGGEPILYTDGAYVWRRNFRGARRMGYRLYGRMRINESGSGRGTPGWSEMAAWQLGGVRGARGFRLDMVAPEERAANREAWAEEVGLSARFKVEYEFSAHKRTYGGAVMAHKWTCVVMEFACRFAIHNRLLGLAGGVR